MATNRDLLKEAIADAKAVKEMAIANAKTALEEAFTPRLKEMMSAKIQEMDKEDNMEEEMKYEEDMDEMMYDEDMDEEMKSKKEDMDEEMKYEEDMDEEMKYEEDMDEEMNLEELLAELEEEEKGKEKVDEEMKMSDEDDVKEGMYMEDDDDMDDMDMDGEGEPLDLEDMTDEDLKKMIEDIIADMVASGELEGGDVEDEEEGEEMEMSDEEEVDLTELLKEIEEEMEGELEEDLDPSLSNEEEQEVASDIMKDAGINLSENKNPDLSVDQYDKIGKIAAKKGELKKAKKIALGGLGAVAAGILTAAAAAGFHEEADMVVKMFDTVPMTPAELAGMVTAAGGLIPLIKGLARYDKAYKTKVKESDEVSELKSELDEAKAEIKSLKSDLNEAVKETNATNLLNAKLLYTNKIFKAKNLNESQKVKVLSSFDKANTTKEAKLVYETLSEGLKTKKSTIKENLGRASKATTIPTTKKPIVESNDVFARMQKLAGIIK